MAVRAFDGIDDEIVFPSPAVGGAAYTVAALVFRTGSTSGLHFFAGRDDGSGAQDVIGFDGNQWAVGNDHQDVRASGTVVPSDGWFLGVATIPAGAPGTNVVARLHSFKLNGGTWVHETSADGSFTIPAATPGGNLRVGEALALEAFAAPVHMGVLAYWSAALTDAEVEGLAANLATQDWANTQPGALEFLADFNQDAVSAVPDLSGHGLDSTAVSGTAVITDNDPVWTFGVGAGGGPEQHSGSAVVSGGGNVSGSGTKRASANAVASGAGAASASGRKTARGSGAASGAGATAASGTKRATGSALVTGSGASSASGTKRAHRSVSLSGTGSATAAGTKRARVSATASGSGLASATGTKRAHGTATATGGGSVRAAGHGPAAPVAPVASDLPTTLALDPHDTTATLDGRVTLAALDDRSTAVVLDGPTTAATVHARVTTLSLAARTTTAALDDRSTEVILDG